MKSNKKGVHTVLSLCLLGLLHPLVCAQNSRDAAKGLIERLRCGRFEWAQLKGVSDKYALVVPITISGRKYKYQLDTGSPATMIYGTEAGRWGWTTGQRSVLVRALEVGGMVIPQAELRVMEKRRPGSTAGTLGLDVLLGHTVVLDYSGKRLCLIPKVVAPAELMRRVSWVPAEIRGGKFFVRAKLNGQELDNIFFDTGASAFPLIVDLESWKSLTTRGDEAAATTKLTVSAWGEPVTYVGAAALGPLEVGSIRMERPTVYYREAQPDFFKKWFSPAAGLMGNAPFWDEVVVLDLSARPAFGILR